MDEGRARKLADRIARIVAEMLERRVKDPRLGFVTVTDARLSGDLREATVYYTVYGSAEEQAGTAAALKSATGLIRSEVGRQTGLRHTPSLAFVRDTLPEGARHLEELVAQARAADEALAAARAGAEPAGDPDPYRIPGDAGPQRVAGDTGPYPIPGDQADGGGAYGPGGGRFGPGGGGYRPGGGGSGPGGGGSGPGGGGSGPGGGGPLGAGALAAGGVPGAGDVPAADPEEAYPDQVYPGDPEDAGRGGSERWAEDRGNAALGRGYPAGPAGPGGSRDVRGRGRTARWRR